MYISIFELFTPPNPREDGWLNEDVIWKFSRLALLSHCMLRGGTAAAGGGDSDGIEDCLSPFPAHHIKHDCFRQCISSILESSYFIYVL